MTETRYQIKYKATTTDSHGPDSGSWHGSRCFYFCFCTGSGEKKKERKKKRISRATYAYLGSRMARGHDVVVALGLLGFGSVFGLEDPDGKAEAHLDRLLVQSGGVFALDMLDKLCVLGASREGDARQRIEIVGGRKTKG